MNPFTTDIRWGRSAKTWSTLRIGNIRYPVSCGEMLAMVFVENFGVDVVEVFDLF
jgi:hypothetical protein